MIAASPSAFWIDEYGVLHNFSQVNGQLHGYVKVCHNHIFCNMVMTHLYFLTREVLHTPQHSPCLGKCLYPVCVERELR